MPQDEAEGQRNLRLFDNTEIKSVSVGHVALSWNMFQGIFVIHTAKIALLRFQFSAQNEGGCINLTDRHSSPAVLSAYPIHWHLDGRTSEL